MSTSPASDQTPDPAPDPARGVVAFTARGDAALDELVSTLVAGCDGTTASITAVLEQVLGADVDDLAAGLSATAVASAVPAETASIDVDETTPGESPDQAARRRMGARTSGPAPGGPDGPRATGHHR